MQTIAHSCTVLPLDDYSQQRKADNDVDDAFGLFYLAGFYDPTSGHLSFEPDVLLLQQN